MNTKRIMRISSAALLMGLSLSPLSVAIASQLHVDVEAPSSPSDWWNNYSMEFQNGASESVELRGAVIEFSLEHQVDSLQWSSVGGLSYPQIAIEHQNQGDTVFHRATLTFDEGDWIKTALESGDAFKLGFGVSGQIADLAAFESSIRFISDDDGSPEPPPESEVSILSPANGAEIELGQSTEIAANATAKIDSKVIMHANGKQLAVFDVVQETQVYRHNWQPETSGQQVIKVSVVSPEGEEQTAQTVSVSVLEEDTGSPPEVAFVSPNDGAEFELDENVAIKVNASDPDDDLREVNIYANGETVCEFDATATNDFACDWKASKAGNTELVAEAIDAEDLRTTSSIKISVTDDGGTPPIDPPPGLSCDIEQIYREDGLECMADDKPRRIVGYFTSWRDGSNDLPTYLVSDIPWEKLTHINYAFAGVHPESLDMLLSKSATNMTWPGVEGAEMDPEFSYTGHFNLLNKYKKQHPDVKTIIALGGWAESGGFYTGTTNADCSVNHQGINTIADNAIAMMRKYGFDGIDYDYEYPTSMMNAGNPVDWPYADKCRNELFGNYVELMKVTRDKIDQAGEEDGRRYMFTIAAPSSGYLLRGMENFQVGDYLDYINIMSYDFHGTWNHYVAHNAALFDSQTDPELEAAGIYDQEQWGGVGYLNVAWSAAYFRGAVEPAKLNIGVPYYTRGWSNVAGGQNGMNGEAPLPDQTQCQEGTGMNDPCGEGAHGVDNIWHDLDNEGKEIASGVVPMWHAKNLEFAESLGLAGSMPSYGEAWGLDPENPDDIISGKYVRHFDDKAKVPWLWNESKKVFLSTEDEESLQHKIDFVKDGGFGGLMIWELAGDYDFDEKAGEYYMGDTMTTMMYESFRAADDMDLEHNDLPAPQAHVDLDVSFVDFPGGDTNYPINPTLKVVNNSAQSIPAGSKFQFLIATSTSDTITDWNGAGLTVTESGGHDNFLGEKPNSEIKYHHVAEVVLNPWAEIAPGGEATVSMVFYIPATMGTEGMRLLAPANDEGVTTIGLKKHFADLPEFEFAEGDNPGNPGEPGKECDFDVSTVPVYNGADTQWPQTDWQGNPSHATKPDLMRHNGFVYQAQWWTNSEPGSDSSWLQHCEIK